MKKTAKALAVMLAVLLMMPLAMASCTKTADDGQNPAMNFVGYYVCDRANIFIGAGEEGMNATVTWSSSAAETSAWIMSGTFDADKLQFEYHDCVRTDYVYGEDGEAVSEEEVYMNGHGFMTFSEGDPLTLTWQDDQEKIADGMTFEYAGAMPEEGAEIPNPWSTAASAEEAAQGAGLDGFTVPEGSTISLGEVKVSEYRYMAGMAEADIEFPAVQMTIRKAGAELSEDGDISGDYNEYAHEWTQDAGGIEVKCFGNREGEATKSIWQTEDGMCYSINVLGLGGDTDYGLPADDLAALVSAVH